MKLYVTRHGQTQYNIETKICGRTDVPLTEYGISQAEDLAESLKQTPIDMIISSPLIRAKKTAEIVSSTLGIPMQVDERLAERDYGVIDGTFEGTAGFMDDWVQFTHIYENGESWLRVAQRVYNFIEELPKKYADKNVLVISHGGVCRVMNSYFESQSNDEFFAFNLGNCKVMEYDL